MKYFGGKVKIGKEIAKFINETYLRDNKKPFIDLFCGGCNIVSHIEPNRLRVANDKHKYLIAMWKELQNGWIPPSSISEYEYETARRYMDVDLALSGFIGFNCSFSAKWFGGYARGKTNDGRDRNYCDEGKRHILKQMQSLEHVLFINKDYRDITITEPSVIYCDIPYKDTTSYSKREVGGFNHDEFFEWVKDNSKNNIILISEYAHNVPDGFSIVWQRESRQNMVGKRITNEVLIKYDGGL